MRKDVIKLIRIVSVLFALVMISGCALNYAETDRIGTDRFDIRSGGLGYQDKWKEEAKKACPNGYSIVERIQCGSDCWQGSIKCE